MISVFIKLRLIFFILLLTLASTSCLDMQYHALEEIPVQYDSILNAYANPITFLNSIDLATTLYPAMREKRIVNRSVAASDYDHNEHFLEWEEEYVLLAGNLFDLEIWIAPSFRYFNYYQGIHQLYYQFINDVDSTLFSLDLTSDMGKTFLNDTSVLLNSGSSKLYIQESAGIICYISAAKDTFYHEEYVDFFKQ